MLVSLCWHVAYRRVTLSAVEGLDDELALCPGTQPTQSGRSEEHTGATARTADARAVFLHIELSSGPGTFQRVLVDQAESRTSMAFLGQSKAHALLRPDAADDDDVYERAELDGDRISGTGKTAVGEPRTGDSVCGSSRMFAADQGTCGMAPPAWF